MSLTIQQAQEAVGRGAELLDTHEPGWESKITLATLDMNSARACILGQVWGDYWNYDGWGRLGLSDVEKRAWCGFTTLAADWNGMAFLSDAWKRLIVARRRRR